MRFVTRRRPRYRSLVQMGRFGEPEARGKRGETGLIRAVNEGTLPLVKRMLARGDSARTPDKCGTTPLVHACQRGHMGLVRLLLARGARADESCGYDGKRPLVCSIGRRLDIGRGIWRWQNHPNAVPLMRLLLNHGAKFDAPERWGHTALMSAATHRHVAALQFLLQQGADVNAQIVTGYTALMFAVHRRDTSLIRLLLAHGADPTLGAAWNRPGRNALAIARRRGFDEIVALLEEACERQASERAQGGQTGC